MATARRRLDQANRCARRPQAAGRRVEPPAAQGTGALRAALRGGRAAGGSGAQGGSGRAGDGRSRAAVEGAWAPPIGSRLRPVPRSGDFVLVRVTNNCRNMFCLRIKLGNIL